MIEISKPICLSASGYYLYSRCPYAYYLHYVERIKSKRDKTKLTLSKIVHDLGTRYLLSKSDGCNKIDLSRIIEEQVISEFYNQHSKVTEQQYDYFMNVCTELFYKYRDILKFIRNRGKNISVEESYGSSIREGIQITENWAWKGSADIVLFNDNYGDIIYDAKWTWNTKSLNTNQIFLYATIHELLLKRPVTKVGFLVFGPQKIIEYGFDLFKRDNTIERMDTTAAKIINCQFSPSPSCDICLFCDYIESCKYGEVYVSKSECIQK